MNKILRFLEKYIIPKFLYRLFQPIYHYFLVALAAFIYGFPSRKMFVIGVTGTKGKTTTCNLIAHIFNSNGLKTGMATTVNFRIGEEEWLNKTGHTMLGRFQLQKLLAKMLKLGCHYAVIETSSEGILQYRHRFIDYDMAVFTNLSSEHLERHGGFENYRTAKIKLFEKIAKKENSFGVYNLDDKNVDYFLKPAVKNKYGYQIKLKIKNQKLNHILEIEDINLLPDKSKFTVNKEDFEIPLIGEFNVYNTAAAICVAMFQNIPIKQIKKSLVNVKPIPGRMEKINEGQNFSVFVDYAHTEDALKEALSALRVFCKNKIIVVFGCGGDRDKAKRFK
ncbi:MAG TPA: UDP-N-acetylmuramyl-tripeptide synthetase, partial [Candidatus Wolfebacteria bacterium]|nr:UDP-N-acetylmuramyl-tripeptide synthetase [Candidatus Wolfebacteria bacterium]